MDLISRKILRDNGTALAELLAEMEKTCELLTGIGQEAIQIIDQAFRSGLSCLRQTVTWLKENYQEDTNVPGAIAVNFLMLMGTVCGGWRLAKTAQIL